MLAGLVELNVRITFLCQAQVNHAGSDVSEIIAAIKRQLALNLLRLNLSNFFASAHSTHRAVATLTDSYTASDVVFASQARYRYIKLQHTNRTNDQVTDNCGNRTEHLHRACFGKLYQPFEQLFFASADLSGGYDGTVLVRSSEYPVNFIISPWVKVSPI